MHQHAKTQWLRDDDLNTKFLHVATSSRRKVNKIISLVDLNNNRVTSEGKLCEVASDYFIDLFQAQNNDINPVIDLIHETISLKYNGMLETSFVMRILRMLFSLLNHKNVPYQMTLIPDSCISYG